MVESQWSYDRVSRFASHEEFYKSFAEKLYKIFGGKENKSFEYYLTNCTPYVRRWPSKSFQNNDICSITRYLKILHSSWEDKTKKKTYGKLKGAIRKRLSRIFAKQDLFGQFSYDFFKNKKIVSIHFDPWKSESKDDIFSKNMYAKLLTRFYQKYWDVPNIEISWTSWIYNKEEYRELHPSTIILKLQEFEYWNFIWWSVFGQFEDRYWWVSYRADEFIDKIDILKEENNMTDITHEDIYECLKYKPMMHLTPIEEYYKKYWIWGHSDGI